MSFSKGLHHNEKTGLIEDSSAFEAFRAAIDGGLILPFSRDSNLKVSSDKKRAWEAPTAGVVYDLQGPDAQAVTLPPAPALGSEELSYEMAEVYQMAFLRDEPFASFSTDAESPDLDQAIGRLNGVSSASDWASWRKRKFDENGELNKLAANISIGRNMAGVHYYSDYYDSVRMGEEIAIGMLEEQALCYPADKFVLTLRKFDGDFVAIGNGTL